MDENNEVQQNYDRKDILAFIIALYKIIIPQLILIGVGFFIVAYLLLTYWLK